MTRKDLQDLSRLRLREAEALYKARLFDGSVYLAGCRTRAEGPNLPLASCQGVPLVGRHRKSLQGSQLGAA